MLNKFVHIGFLAGGLLLSASITAQAAAPTPETVKLLEEAKTAVRAAKEKLPTWIIADAGLADAERAALAGEDDKSQAAARTVKNQAATALNAGYELQAKIELEKARSTSGLTDDQFRRMQSGDAAIKRGDSEAALEILLGLNAELKESSVIYTVVRGDSLWRIAGKAEIYGNPHLWPLIYKANTRLIQDPDLIFPNQDLNVRKNNSIGDVYLATEYAKNRGAWSLKRKESGDGVLLRKFSE